MRLKYLLEKEFKQFRRNPIFPRLVFIFPVIILLIFPWVTTFEVKNIIVTVIDNDNSSYSRELVNEIKGSKYFILNSVDNSYSQGYSDIENGKSDVIFTIPNGFEKDLLAKKTDLQISANAVNGIKGGLGSGYLSQIVQSFIEGKMAAHGITMAKPVNVIEQNWFNPYLDYKVFMIPALITMIIIMLCGFLPTLNIVSEKEVGTIEQINVTPVGKWEFILAKLIPYWIMGLVAITIGFIIAWLVYGFTPIGGFGTIYLAAVFFILMMSGIGLIISNYSQTMQQAMFVMFFFVVVFVLMSGLFTPISSMPVWAQYIAGLNPPKYFIIIMRSVYLKGTGIMENGINLAILVIFAVIINGWAVISYRKRNN